MAIVMVQHSAFNGAVLLRSQTFEVALLIREVQLSAVSVAAASDADASETFRSVYGVHFSTESNNQLFSIFRDGDDDSYYDIGEAFGAQGILDERFEIREVRTVSGGVATVQANLSVVFQRPNFDARFFTSTAEVTADSVQIDVARKDIVDTGQGGVIRTIEVSSAGQISVLE